MATPAQAAAATVGAGSLAAAGAYGITQAVNGSEESTPEEQTTEDTASPINEMPTEVSTFVASDVSQDPYTGKLISFIKETNLSSLVKPTDEKWWKWAYENKFSKNKQGKTLDSLFNSVDDSEKLKKACDDSYKANKEEYSFETNKHLLQNISDYCTKGNVSIDISEPKVDTYGTPKTDSGYTNGVLSVATNAAVLVKSEKGNYNDLWWKWAFKNLYKAQENSSSDLFKDITVGFSEETSGTPKSLHKQCDEAYKKPYSELNNSNKDLFTKIKKLCSKNQNAELILPEPANPTKVSSDTEYTSEKNLVKKDQNKTKLIDPKNNQDWWNWSFDINFPKTGDPKKAKLPSLFSSVDKGYEAINGGGVTSETPSSLNKACYKAYSKNRSELESTENQKEKIIDWVKKLCSPSSLSAQLVLPDN